MKIYKHNRFKVYATDEDLESLSSIISKNFANKSELNLTGVTVDISNSAPQTIFANLIKLQKQYVYSNGVGGIWEDIVDLIFERGNGLGNSANVSGEIKEVLSYLPKVSIKSPFNLTLYRTDRTNWLKSYDIGATVPITSILQTTLSPNLVIFENVGKVQQRMIIKVPTGKNIICSDNAYELQVDVIGNQSYKILGITYDDKNIPTYTVEIL